MLRLHLHWCVFVNLATIKDCCRQTRYGTYLLYALKRGSYASNGKAVYGGVVNEGQGTKFYASYRAPTSVRQSLLRHSIVHLFIRGLELRLELVPQTARQPILGI